MIDPEREAYPYLEEINEGILRQFVRADGTPLRVLDVGCGQATLGAEIRALGHVVWGIDASAIAVAKATRRIDRCLHVDLLDFTSVAAALADEDFDVIVFSDVLEHLYDPLAVLRFYHGFLRPGGRLLISVPNVLNWQTRVALLFGRFEYQDTGVMDRTHVRFFTFRSATRMLEAAGCAIEKTDFTPHLTRALLPVIKKALVPRAAAGGGDPARAIIDSPLFSFYFRWIYPVEYVVGSLCRPLFAFRIVVVARDQRREAKRTAAAVPTR